MWNSKKLSVRFKFFKNDFAKEKNQKFGTGSNFLIILNYCSVVNFLCEKFGVNKVHSAFILTSMLN